PAVRGDHNIKRRRHFLHRRCAHKLTSMPMRLHKIAGEDTGDLATFIESHVEKEAWPGPLGDAAHLLPDWIAGSDSERGQRIVDVPRAVVAHDSFQPSDTRHDPFRTAAEPCEEM